MVFKRGMAIAVSVTFAAMMWSGGKVRAAVDVCSLLTPAEASGALGVPEVIASAGPNRCIWTPKKAGASGKITVMVASSNNAAKYAGAGTAVSGVGDEANSLVVGDSAVLRARKGSTWFSVMANGVGDLGSVQKMEQLVGSLVAKKL